MEDHINILEANGNEQIGGNKDQKLESTKDYQSMQMEFFDILQQDKKKEAAKATGGAASHEENDEESELVSLSLGISSKDPAMDIEKKKNSNRTEKMVREENLDNEGLALGLDIRFEPSSSAPAEATNNHSPKVSFDEEGKELEELTEMWPPSKVLKTTTTTTGDGCKASQYTHVKKARVSIRARCDTQTMNDGCQWRKYGQKIAKGNPCPRSYYRCTVSSSCPVKKQVQRCAEDMSILITTYEGTHNHPLPTSAIAMASTTSAAASILQSRSLNSKQGLASSDTVPVINPSVAYNLNSIGPEQLYFPISSISTSNFHPTITLDLAAPPTSSYFGKFPPGFFSTLKYSPTNLSFSSTFSPLQSSTVLDSSSWNSYNGCFNYGELITQNGNQNGSPMNNGKQPFQGHIYQPNYSNHAISQQPLPNPIASATKAITANPKFQSALATALTTYVANGAGGAGLRENHVGAESAALNLKLDGDTFKKNTVYSSSQNGIGSASFKSLSVSSSALNAQQGNIVFPLRQPSKISYSSPSKKSNQFLEQKK